MTNGSFAAADTTGNAMAFTFWHTVNCRRAWRKLCDEIRGLKKEELTSTRLSHLKYLNAVIEESTPVLTWLI
jgi:cytochrome P450